jgi:hypothetical protein
MRPRRAWAPLLVPVSEKVGGEWRQRIALDLRHIEVAGGTQRYERGDGRRACAR